MPTQWHPLFVHLLRPLVESHYEVRTGLEVGDAPRTADLVLLRLIDGMPEFHGVWRYLTAWNILEYKGPSVSARLEHVDLLVELGLGIERRLNELGRKERRKPAALGDVSFWYLTHKIGRRFLKAAAARLGTLEPRSTGVWTCSILQRPMFLVSLTELPVEEDNAVFHVLHSEPADKGLAALRLTVERPSLWDLYRSVFESLYPEQIPEVDAMAKSRTKGPVFHIKEVAQYIGMKRAVEELGEKEIIEQIGKDKIIDTTFSFLSDAERAELKRRLHEAERRKK